MTYEIRKNVPIPSRRGGPGAAAKYPWKEMVVGDSFVVPIPPGKTKAVFLPAISSQAGAAGKRLGRKFEIRLIAAGEVGVWRTA
ncbi:hypothetical protein [Brevundimonas sp.]|uniref:hypothetical protein n=1 Tax=Brevundimonas sp. TaxID=1871086 RepID=UPI0028AFC0CC|nr:hypothetical protein [Brevundimonas sp.]